MSDAPNDPRQDLFDLLEAGVRDGIYPGAVALVSRRGGVVYDEAHGVLATHPACSVKDIEITRDTIFDLASLTKVLGTTTLFAQLVSENHVALDDEVPEPWRHACPGATLSDLLEHCSGLPAHREYFTMVDPFDADKVLHHVVATARAYPSRAQAIYSDVGFLILGAWIERLLERPLDEAFADRIAYRFGLDDAVLPTIGYRRLFSPAALRWELERRIAPTEIYDRHLHPEGVPSYLPVREATGLAHGVVHDDNAWVMGGVAGHAGLFGTAAAVFEIARAWAENNLPGVDPSVRDAFLQASDVPGSTRRRGWDSPSPDGSGSSGGVLSSAAFGHTGFTGTSLWIDPDPEQGPWIIILLTNRVHPVRTDDRIKEFRQRFHELATRLR